MKKMIQRIGDRDKVAWSIKDYAFTIPSNPMSDRVQLVCEIYEIHNDCDTDQRAKRGGEKKKTPSRR